MKNSEFFSSGHQFEYLNNFKKHNKVGMWELCVSN